jgi:hypothetical protein
MTENKWNINGDINFFVSNSGDSASNTFVLDKFKSVEITLIYSNDKYYWFVHQYYFA